jgi:DNA-binding SARP family transcriptional activator
VIATRESLRQKCLDALLKLGELYVRASVARLQDAVTVLQRAVAFDPYSEAAHVALIRAYVQLGEHNRAREQYRALVAVLKEIGAPPSAETKALSAHLFGSP